MSNLLAQNQALAAQLAALEESIPTQIEAAVIEAKLAIQKNLDGIVSDAEPCFAALMAAYPNDANVLKLGAALGKAKGHTTAARRAKLESDIAAANQAKAAAEAQLAAL